MLVRHSAIRLTSICLLLLLTSLWMGAGIHAKTTSPRLTNIAVKKGKSATMKLSGLDQKQYPSSSLTWTSSDKKIATVSSDGTVTGKETGQAKITVTVKNTHIRLTGTVRVVSFFRTKRVEIKNKPEEYMLTGTSRRLLADVSPSNARDKKVIWSSSKKKVATVTSKGTVRARKRGTTTIKASVEGTSVKTSFKLRVIKPVKLKKITITGNKQVFVGSQLQLAAALSPKNTTQNRIGWKTSSKKIATVNSRGQVTGKKAGTATITATEKDSKKKKTYKIKVVNVPVTGIHFAANNITSMQSGTKQKLTVQIAPWNATNKTIKWSSSNKTAATVDENGIVTALRPIELVDITAKSADNKALSCTWRIKITNTTGYVTKSTLDALDLTVVDHVMITAHPDDETLWGGGHLLEDEYLVVCMTHGWNEKRKQEFVETMRTTNDKYLILNYPDARKQFSNGSYETDTLSTCRSAMQKDIERILSYKKWKTVVTHNPFGEYGKYHHQQISSMVTTYYNKYCKSFAELWYFGRFYTPGKIPGDQIEPALLAIKQKMVDRYYPTAKGAIKAFGHMIPYENWIPASEW